MRIDGLVRAGRWARQALRRGIPAEEREEFRAWVREVVMRVEEICDRYGARPEDLPGPSLRAWRFLAGLDLDRLPAPPPGAPPPGPPLKIPGIVSAAETLTGLLWYGRRDGDGAETLREQIRDEASSSAEFVADAAGNLGGRPTSLPPRSRSAYALLRWLAAPGNPDRYVAALLRVEPAVREALGEPFDLRILPAKSPWAVGRGRRGPRVRIHPGFLAEDDVAVAALGRVLAPGGSRKAAAFLRRWLAAGPAAEAAAEFDAALG